MIVNTTPKKKQSQVSIAIESFKLRTHTSFIVNNIAFICYYTPTAIKSNQSVVLNKKK